MSRSTTSALLSRLRPLQRPITRNFYHSYDHPAPPGPFNATEQAILAAALPHVPAHGFTDTSLSLGAKELGYLDVSTNLFPRGAFTLVHYHLLRQREALAQEQDILRGSSNDGKPLGVGAKVKALTWARLAANKAIIHRWQEALALMSLPSNISPSLHELHLLSDEVWFLAGDTSVDSSWYTKRASLSSIYATSELFMTTDQSPEFAETKLFLDRRFAGNNEMGKIVGSVGQWIGFTAGAAVNVLRSKGVQV